MFIHQPFAGLRAAILLGVATCSAPLSAQAIAHSDVSFRYADGRIKIEPQQDRLVIPQVFPTEGFFRQSSSNPGFYSETDVGGGIGPGDAVVYSVLDRLYFWNGSFQEPAAETTIRIVNNPRSTPDTVISGSTGEQLGGFDPLTNPIGQANALGDFHAHVDYQLEPVDSDPDLTPELGAYGVQLTLATDATGVEDSDPFFVVFQFGLENDLFQQALDEFQALLTTGGLPGDFDDDGALTAADIDLLSVEVNGGSHADAFDLNSDTLVDQQDRVVWVEELAGSYFGDANLDRAVGFSDFVVLSSSYGQTGGWAAGDFDGDQLVEFPDFVLLSTNYGRQAPPDSVPMASVPEPLGRHALLLGGMLVCAIRSWRTERGVRRRV
jgi:hypothetical protein